MKKIHSETDILTMPFWNKEKGRQTYQSPGPAFGLVRENGAGQITVPCSTGTTGRLSSAI